MPILHIKALPQDNKEVIPEALKKTTLAISAQYGCEPQQVWATWQELHPGWYVEGENEAFDQPTQNHPPICELICFQGKSSSEIEQLLKITAKTLSLALGIEDNIFITYREAKSGEVIAGNGIVRK